MNLTVKVPTRSVFLLLSLLGLSFGPIRMDDDPAAAHQREVREWHAKRIASLKREDGWLNLAGLFWLKPGKNSFGSDPQNDLVFPKGKSAAFLGHLYLENGLVRAEIAAGAEVRHTDQIAEKLTIFSPDQPSPVVLSHQSLRWFVIKRGDAYAVRLRDLENPNLKAFKGIDTYPPRLKWKVTARLEPATADKKIPIIDVLGQISHQKSPGTLVFTLKGKEYRLDAVDSGDQLFILFADETNRKHTYPTGRFLYAAQPGPDGTTVLDFNKSINPPCAFSDFATCPLPPKQNKLALAVTAGEKRYH
jgi:uncharacterized protein